MRLLSLRPAALQRAGHPRPSAGSSSRRRVAPVLRTASCPQGAPPAELLAPRAADDYVAVYVGSNRVEGGCRSSPRGSWSSRRNPVLPADSTAPKPGRAGESRGSHRHRDRRRGAPRWVNAAKLSALPAEAPLGHAETRSRAVTPNVGQPTRCRPRLTRAVLSPAASGRAWTGRGSRCSAFAASTMCGAPPIQAAGPPAGLGHVCHLPAGTTALMWSGVSDTGPLIWRLTWENPSSACFPRYWPLIISLPRESSPPVGGGSTPRC